MCLVMLTLDNDVIQFNDSIKRFCFVLFFEIIKVLYEKCNTAE